MPTGCSVCFRPGITSGFAHIFTVFRWSIDRIPLEYRQSLYGANKPIGFIYFIETGVGSLVNTMTNGQAAEVGTSLVALQKATNQAADLLKA